MEIAFCNSVVTSKAFVLEDLEEELPGPVAHLVDPLQHLMSVVEAAEGNDVAVLQRHRLRPVHHTLYPVMVPWNIPSPKFASVSSKTRYT